jgi:hypothetical protein
MSILEEDDNWVEDCQGEDCDARVAIWQKCSDCR